MPGRRDLLKAGVVLAAAPLVGGVASRAKAAAKPAANGPFTARAYGNTSATGPLAPLQIKRRAVGPNDVLLDVLYCGICHSDIHQARNEWSNLPTVYPCVPGHEIIGRVQAVGSAVTKFKVGDIGGVGCMVDSCGTCENCLSDREQNCLKGATFTYNSPDRATGENTLGGYSEKMVVAERFVIRIPPGADLAATAPLLSAGITTFSPMQHWRLSSRQRVGVIGLGGLGHMAVKLAAARKAEVRGAVIHGPHSPCVLRYRRNMRTAVTTSFADFTPVRAARSDTNLRTATAVYSAGSPAPSVKSSRIRLYTTSVDSTTPRWRRIQCSNRSRISGSRAVLAVTTFRCCSNFKNRRAP